MYTANIYNGITLINSTDFNLVQWVRLAKQEI